MTSRDLFGLTVNIEESQIEQFAALRSNLEPVIRRFSIILEEKPHTAICSNFVKVPGNNPYYLTFCIVGRKIFLSIYDKDKKNVSSNCNWGDIKSLGNSEMNRLANIIENYIKNNIKMPSLNALELAWQEEIKRRKALAKDENKKDFDLADDFVMDFDKLLSNAMANRPPPKTGNIKPNTFER